MRKLSELKTGIYTDISDAEYFADNSRVNCSALKKVIKNKGATIHLTVKNNITEDMRFGTCFHTLTLEPEEFFNRVKIVEDYDGRTAAGKAYKESLSSVVMINEKGRNSDDGMVIGIKQADYEQLRAMYKGLCYNIDGTETLAGKMLDNCGSKEVVLLFEYLGVPCKCKIDGITNDWEILDLKTCASVESSKFAKSVFDQMYDIQSMFYKIALKEFAKYIGAGEIEPEFYFLAVEKTDGVYLGQTYQTNLWDITAKQLIDEYLLVAYQALSKKQYTGYRFQDANKSEQVPLENWQERNRIEMLIGKEQ